MLATIKGSFSVSSSSCIIVAMVLEGSFKRGDWVTCPMTDGTLKTLSIKGIETIAPSDPQSKIQYPIALIVESFKPSEVMVGQRLTLCSTPAAAAGTPTPVHNTPQPLPSRKIS